MEVLLQKSVDIARLDEATMSAAKVMLQHPDLKFRSPKLQQWLSLVLLDNGHENEKLIDLAKWSDEDIGFAVNGTTVVWQLSSTKEMQQLARRAMFLIAQVCSERFLYRVAADPV